MCTYVYIGYGMVWIVQRYRHCLTRYLMGLLILANVPMALYFSLVHQRGTVAVMDYIREVCVYMRVCLPIL